MRLKTTIAITLTCLFVSCNILVAQVLVPSFADSHTIQSLNGTWKFKYLPSTVIGVDSLFYEPGFDVSKWAGIKTPGNWELQGFAEPSYGKGLKNGTGLYRRDFIVPAGWKDNPIYIAFDGVQFGYTVWVNGHQAGYFTSSYNRHVIDITAFVKPGQSNTLALKVITHPKGWEFDTNDDWSLSGIIRDVTLFSLPPVYVKDVTIQTFVHTTGASIDIKAMVEGSNTSGLQLQGQLIDPAGKLIRTFMMTAGAAKTGQYSVDFASRVNVEKPLLWSAEKPTLYTLRLSLKNNGAELQKITERIGIREVSWAGGILKLNGSPIKLRGATHHDLSPVNGRAVTEPEMLKDLKLMHEANINFIRTSHYPPHPRLLELCDSLGFYVIDEVPFGYGDELLEDTSYLPLLIERAYATIARDKNRPSVIVWSVGNENPVTDIGLKAGRYVKTLDKTRPYCFPQTPSVFEKMAKSLPDSLDLFAPHYPLEPDLQRYAGIIDRPMIVTEYAHALGLDFGRMEALYEIMYANPKLAGGAVWEFFDQGILRKTKKSTYRNDSTVYAWASADSIYDTGDNQGTDGIVYANRVPQVDYWQVRKVYSPVKAFDDTLQYQPGKQTFRIRVNNRYDFTNLSAINCKWKLFADTTVISSGTVPLNCKPHDTTTLVINAVLPAKPTANNYYLLLSFEDKASYRFYEKTYLVKQKENASILGSIVQKGAKQVKAGNVIESGNYRFELTAAGGIQLKNKTGNVIIAEGPFARVGRKPTISETATRTSRRSKDLYTTWSPFLLSHPETTISSFDEHKLVVHYKYQPDTPKLRTIDADLEYSFSDSGYINVHYQLSSKGKGVTPEAGISLLIPSALSEFRWIGKGPYAAYPGKDRLSEFGIYHLNSNDLYYAGNRQHVSCAVFTDEKGAGFVLLADNADISVERTASGIIVSHNATVSGRFNKYTWPEDLYSFEDGKTISGSFKIIPLSGTWPAALKKLFGESNKTAQPFQPFYHSYDQ
ncbi:MAG: glycoside hydrolase family 2 TIM barrel-domain containing protein [Chitinophagaceae bacterium]